MEPAGGRTRTIPLCRTGGPDRVAGPPLPARWAPGPGTPGGRRPRMGAAPAWYPGVHIAPWPTHPRMGDQAVPAGRMRSVPEGGQTMFRIQRALPERYTTAEPGELADRIGAAKATLGSRLLILGHHYQRDEVMRWADARGDSFGLSRLAAAAGDAEFVVFCRVHFMAESADVLTGPHQQVILPDLNAGCSMADMADLESVEEAWEELAEVTDIDAVVPITYMNSAAALKAFVGRHGGAVCTSSNARAVLTWALGGGAAVRPGE